MQIPSITELWLFVVFVRIVVNVDKSILNNILAVGRDFACVKLKK